MRYLLIILFTLVAATAGAQDRFTLSGPYVGGATQVFAGADGKLYAITLSQQVIRSTDDGVSWQECGEFQASPETVPAIQQLAIDSSGYLYGRYNLQLWLSADSGAHWSLGLLPPTSWISYLEVSPGGVLYVTGSSGLDTGIYRSSNKGVDWVLVPPPPGNPRLFDRLSVAPDGSILAGQLGALWRTTNDGIEWKKMPLQMAGFEHAEVLLAAAEGRMWAVIAPYGRLVTSNDGGTSWTEIHTDGLPLNTTSFNLAITPSGTLFLSTQTGIYFCFDQGVTWAPTRPMRAPGSPCWVAASPSGTVVGIVGDMKRSTDNGFGWYPSQAAGGAARVTRMLETNDGTTIVMGAYSGMYRSTDGGANWMPSNDGLPDDYQNYSMFRGRGNAIFIGSEQGGGVYRSLDNGRSWKAMNTQMLGTWIIDGAILPDSTILITSSAHGVWRSSNNGDSWEGSNTGIHFDSVCCLAVMPDGSVLLSTRGQGILRSTDNGHSWTSAGITGMTATVVYFLFLSSDGIVFAGTMQEGIFRSRDHGLTWERSGALNWPRNRGASWLENEAGTIYYGAQGFQRSLDNGNSWCYGVTLQLSDGFVAGGAYVWGLITDHTGRIHVGVAIPPYQGAFRMYADSGTRWEKKSDVGDVHSVRQFSDWSDIWLLSPRGIISANPFPGWIATDLARTLPDLDIHSMTDIYPWYLLSGTSDGVYRMKAKSKADGKLDTANLVWEVLGLRGKRINSIVTEFDGKWIFAATDHGVYRSDDSAVTWSAAQNGMGDIPIGSMIVTGSISLLASSPGHGLYRSVDEGLNWSPVGGGLPRRDVTSLAVIGARTIYAGTDSAGLWRSGDDGVTWSQAGASLARASITSVAVNSEGLLFIGTGDGAWRSTDKGATWTRISPEQEGEIAAVGVGGSGRIYVASRDGIYQSTSAPLEPGGPTGVREPTHEQASSGPRLHLLPNPAGGISEARYELARAAHVKITMVDITGRELMVLIDRDQPIGHQSVHFDVSALTAGTYYLRMTIDRTSTTHPITVTR